MGHLLAYLQQKVTFYGLEVKYIFSVKTLDAFLYADSLFEAGAYTRPPFGSTLHTLCGILWVVSVSQ
jgi:hypothetical protein